MARAAFYEESAVSVNARSEARAANALHIVSIVCLVLAGIIVFLSLTIVPNWIGMYLEGDVSLAWLIVQLVVWASPVLALVGLFVLFRFLKRRKNVSYDYTFVEDEVRVVKVLNGRVRKPLATLHADMILKVGYEEKDSFRRTLDGLRDKRAIYLTPNREPAEGKMFIYLFYSAPVEKKLYVLECRQQLLEFIVMAAGITKFERQ